MPEQSVVGALTKYITTADPESFQPMNSNFGLLPQPYSERRLKKHDRRKLQAELAVTAIERVVETEMR